MFSSKFMTPKAARPALCLSNTLAAPSVAQMSAQQPRMLSLPASSSQRSFSTAAKIERLNKIQLKVRELTLTNNAQKRNMSPSQPRDKRAFSTAIDVGAAYANDIAQSINLNNQLNSHEIETHEQSIAEPLMCVQNIIEVCNQNCIGRDTKVLDFGAGSGQLGTLLVENGVTEVYGQEGSDAKKQRLETKGIYKEVETFIVGRQSLPKSYRRNFDIVACAGGLGTNLLPARSFDDMLNALRPGGHAVFTVSKKHLGEKDSFRTGYRKAIEKLVANGSWQPVAQRDFIKSQGSSEEHFALFVFQKSS